ncbi:MAG: glycosyltransferase family 2 protein [Trueperaceae bacterium]
MRDASRKTPPSSFLLPPSVCSILIPAFNEAKTVASVIRVALESNLGTVLVVDDGSSDGTSSTAKAAGATVLTLPQNLGKGGAVHEGVHALGTEVVLLIDADLTGLTVQHLQDLARPVLENKADMSRGVFTGGRWTTTAAQQLTPQLNGQRAIKREKFLDIRGLRNSRYGIETIITDHAKRNGWRTIDVALANVSQVMKEEKHGFWYGFKVRLGMYRDIFRAYLESVRRKT